MKEAAKAAGSGFNHGSCELRLIIITASTDFLSAMALFVYGYFSLVYRRASA
jgi:hypothetical protein